MLKESAMITKLKQALLLHCVVADQIKRRMKSKKLMNQEEKRILSSVVSRKILKKYDLMKVANEMLGITEKRLKFNSLRRKDDRFRRRKYKNSISDKVKQKVRDFLEKDNNSRMMPGKRDTITRNKIQKQKRLLSDSLKSLHKKFLQANKDMKVSYTMFCKLRPFWIVDPKCGDRETFM